MRLRYLVMAAITLWVSGATASLWANDYDTSFPLTENPMSESGQWTEGKTDGGLWSDFRTTPGLTFGTQTGAVQFNDSIAIRKGIWGPDQTVRIVVHAQPGQISGEVEVMLRFSITNGNAHGYEVNWNVRADGSQYCQIVKWNGGLGSFTFLNNGCCGSNCLPVSEGTVLEAKVSGTNPTSISVYHCGQTGVTCTLIGTSTDTSSPWLSGAPGIGTYYNGAGTLPTLYGIKRVTMVDTHIINAATCNRPDVVAAVALAVVGDYVEVPDGNCSWNAFIQMPAFGITLAARNPPSVDANDRPTAFTTTITDASNWAPTSGGGLLRWVTAAGSTLHRITGIKWIGQVAGANSDSPNTVFRISGQTQAFRMDHSQVQVWQEVWFNFSGWVNGVVDHNILQRMASKFIGYSHQDAVNNNANGCGGGVQSNGCGDAAWAATEPMGTASCLYFENNAWDRNGQSGGASFVWDGWAGHCSVVRFNTFTDVIWADHGNDSSNRSGGALNAEIYNNTGSFPTAAISFYGYRGGHGMFFNNTGTASNPGDIQKWVGTSSYRYTDCTEGGTSSGPACLGPWWRSQPQAITLTSSGTTATATMASPIYMSSLNGAPSITIFGAVNGVFNSAFLVTSINSGTNSFTFTFAGCGGCSDVATARSPWDGSDTGYPSLQGVGRGKGNLLPAGLNVGIGTWMQQVLQPIYVWGNTKNGNLCPSVGGASCAYTTINTVPTQTDRDIYSQQGVAGTDGKTSGVGVGTALPATCTTNLNETGGGVGFWKTNEGSWNTLLSANTSGRLYRCSATNTWTLHYTPFTYPHPLAVSGGGSSGPPPDLTAPAKLLDVEVQ